MTKSAFEYPALYETANRLSANAQWLHFLLLKAEYTLLTIAAIFTLNLCSSRLYYVAYALIFFLSLGVTLARQWLKPEQDWYRGRALAESIKTSCWRYCMRAEPFGASDSDIETRAEFRNHLMAILQANRHIGSKFPPDEDAKDQITASMEALRGQDLENRKQVYELHRIKEQRQWYTDRARQNDRSSRKWLWVGIGAYIVAIIFVLLQIAYPDWKFWPTAPLIVFASSIVGWMQIRKFNELASAYTLTAHEIGIIQGRLAEISGDESFAEFVNEAEQAFSREHTQWVARQQAQ